MIKTSIALLISMMLLSSASIASSHGYKSQMKAKMSPKNMAMKHANPMPNLMQVTKKFSHELNLSQQQAAKLKKWSDHNGPIMQNMVKELIGAEKDLHIVALSNASQTDLQNKLESVMELRLKIATGKMKCRSNMRNILDDKQWDTVVNIYKNKIMKFI